MICRFHVPPKTRSVELFRVCFLFFFVTSRYATEGGWATGCYFVPLPPANPESATSIAIQAVIFAYMYMRVVEPERGVHARTEMGQAK